MHMYVHTVAALSLVKKCPCTYIRTYIRTYTYVCVCFVQDRCNNACMYSIIHIYNAVQYVSACIQ